MQGFVTKLVAYSAALSVVILFFMAITPFLSKRYSAKGLYYTWLVIVIGLIIPFRPQIDTAITEINIPANVMFINQVTDAPRIPADTTVQIDNAVSGSVIPGVSWWKVAALIWLAGMVIIIIYHIVKHCRFVKMTKRWSESIRDERVMLLMQRVKEDCGISGKIDLCLCPHIGSPLMTGVFNPKILLPMAEYSDDELCFVLKHELIHYKCKDLLYKYLILIATVMHWFNPVVYLMGKAVNTQCEISCDAQVLSCTDDDVREQYCKVLIGVIKNHTKLKTVLSTNFYGGKKGMKKRISSIMDTNKKKIGMAVICLALIITAGIGIVGQAANSDNRSSGTTNNLSSDVDVRLRDINNHPESDGTSVCNVDSRPGLEFYIEGMDIAQIEISSENEYLYAVDWTETQHEKYWNTDYYQTYDEESQTSTFYPERRYDKSMKLTFDEEFDEYGDIWYRWTARNLYEWASEDNYSRFLGYESFSDIGSSYDDMTEEQKLKLAAGDDGSGTTGLGHIQLDGYPEELTEDLISIKITDREGNSVIRYINVKISNNKLNQTVVNASVEK